MSLLTIVALAVGGVVLLVALYDVLQKKHAILRNFPVIGHFRYWFEAVGPELRQYIVTSNDEERPFSRDQRRWVYTSAKQQNNLFGFGTDNDLDRATGHVVIKQSTFPWPDPPPADDREDGPKHLLPCAKVLGGARGRAQAFRPQSVVHVSGMSYGSLSSNAVHAMNVGCRLSGSIHGTGEGGVAPHHEHGADLLWQLGTGYFGCRDERGRFHLGRLQETVERTRVRALEVKLSQGAKPGKGGILPAAKVTPEIARIRGVPVGHSCHSPPGHSEFSDADGLLDFVERLAEATGVPVGIKSAVGTMEFWHELADLMESGTRGVDFIAIDGGEGGTGAAPLVYTDHVALPFKLGMSRVYRVFAERGLQDRIVFSGSGRLGFPDAALLAFALGCDLVGVAREPMMAAGCIQAQLCHSGHCPTGVATQSPWLVRGLDPHSKAHRVANYLTVLRKEIADITRSCGHPHPALVSADQVEILEGPYRSRTVREVFDYESGWGTPPESERDAVRGLMAPS